MSQKAGPPPGFGGKKPLRLKPSATQQKLEKTRPAITPRKKPNDVSVKSIQRIITNLRGLYDNYYQVTFTQDLELKLRNILNEEKCPLSMVGYDKDDNIDNEDDASLNAYDNSLGFAILKCRLLNCQHVIRLSAAKQVVNNTFRTFHDSEFKPISFKSLKTLSYLPSSNNETARRRFKIDLKFYHLLSDACSDTIYVPEQVQSVYDISNSQEYILLYYDTSMSPYNKSGDLTRASFHHITTNKPTFLRFVRGRVQGTLQDLNSKSQYKMNFTYDLSKSSNASQGGLSLKQNETNGGIVLEHVEPSTNSSYKFYLKKEPVSNAQTHFYRYKLVAVRFDFVVKATSPTLSPQFGVVADTNVNNNAQTITTPIAGQQPVVPVQNVTNVNMNNMNNMNAAPMQQLTQQVAATTLSPQQQPMQQGQNINPINIPTQIVTNTPTGPQPVQTLPTTPAQTAVLTVTTPTAIQAMANPSTQYAQFANMNSPQINPSLQQQTTPIQQHQYPINNVSTLTAPTGQGQMAAFPMSPGGSLGLPTAAVQSNPMQPGQSSQLMNSMQYAQPPSSTPMLANPAATNISSILGHNTAGMGAVQHSASVSNSIPGTMASTPQMNPYSPMVDPNIGSNTMTFANAVPTQTQSIMSSVGLSNPVSPGLSNMSPAGHLGYGIMGQHTPGGSLGSVTSPGMSYVQSNQYVPPMSPATQAINSSISTGIGDPQAQQFALMPGHSSSMSGYGGMMQHQMNINQGLNQPQMINNINRGLMNMSQSANNRMRQQQMNPNQNNIVTVVNKQGGGYGNQGGMNQNDNYNNNRGGRYGNQGGMNNRRNNPRNNNNNRGQYQRKIRDKTSQNQNKRLHDARVDARKTIMGRGYHHQMMGSQRKMRQNFMNQNDNQYPGNNNNNNNNQGQGGGQRGGNSAFGFPSQAAVIPQNQLQNKDKDDGEDGKDLSLNPLSPQSDATPTAGQQTTPGGTALASVMSPKTPTMIDHVVDRVYFIAKTQSGSRFVQEKLSDKQYFGLFFKELKCHVAELMVDNFGHYAIEALFSHCDDHQRLILVANLSNHMPQVACHKQGSFSIQAMMDTLSTAEQIKYLVDALNRDIKKIILNHSGHYVILRFLQRYDYPYSKFIHKALMQHTLDLATDHYGLRVMKASVDAGPIQEMSAVFASIVKHANTLVENQYGNYIIQHLLDLGPKDVTDTIKEKMHGKFVRYSKQKFSSNVVEKCLRHSTNELKQGIHSKDWTTIIVRELLTKAGELISDKYGNYCLQTALQAATDHPNLLQEFEKSTKPHLDTLRENVKAKWVKLLESAIEKQKKRNAMPMNMPHGSQSQHGQGGMNQNQHQGPPPNQQMNQQQHMQQNRGNNNGNNMNQNQGPPPQHQQHQQQQMNQQQQMQ